MKWNCISGATVSLVLAVAGGLAAAGHEGTLGRLPATFAGVLPCASCPGVRTAVRLHPDGRYVRRQVHLGEDDGGTSETGKWAVEDRRLTLEAEGRVVSRYAIESEAELRMLDRESRRIDSALDYSLYRVGVPGEVVSRAPPEAWRRIDPENALYLELKSGRVVIELAPDFAPRNVAQIRTLTRSGFYDGLPFYRVIEGFVAQFGDRVGEPSSATVARSLPPEFERDLVDAPGFTPLGAADGYAREVGYSVGFPAARDVSTGRTWLVNCTGAVQMARGNEPESGATEIAIMLGHQRRYLDRNISMVGRVVQGMEWLQKLQRGDPARGGVIEDPARRDLVVRARIAADVPASERTPLEALRTDSAAFFALIESRRNRPEEWFVRWADHIDVCAVPIPVRPASG